MISGYISVTVLVEGEEKWLSNLEKKLSASPNSSTDAEEISEELDVSFFNSVLGCNFC